MAGVRIPELCHKPAGCRMLLFGRLEAVDVDAVFDFADAFKKLSDFALCIDKLVDRLLSFLDFPAGFYAFFIQPVNCFDLFLVTVQQKSVQISGMNGNLSAFNVHFRPPNGVASPSE